MVLYTDPKKEGKTKAAIIGRSTKTLRATDKMKKSAGINNININRSNFCVFSPPEREPERPPPPPRAILLTDEDTTQNNPTGSGGITIKKTSQALLIGVYDEPVTPGQCNIVVERLGDYLIEQGL
ncbi:hypothetical protein ACFX10_043194 [Malus domestica]